MLLTHTLCQLLSYLSHVTSNSDRPSDRRVQSGGGPSMNGHGDDGDEGDDDDDGRHASEVCSLHHGLLTNSSGMLEEE